VSDVIVRTADRSDIREIADVVKRCGKYVRDYSGIRDLETYYDRGWVYAAQLDDDGPIVGFCVCRHNVRNEWSTIYEIGTVPEARGRGVARSLVVVAGSQSPHRRLRLVVDATNVDALRFYASMAFKLLGSRHNRRGDTILDLEWEVDL
jgi:ribosomal protein S18 acetylase RimI-like enzyme